MGTLWYQQTLCLDEAVDLQRYASMLGIQTEVLDRELERASKNQALDQRNNDLSERPWKL